MEAIRDGLGQARDLGFEEEAKVGTLQFEHVDVRNEVFRTAFPAQ